jgi:hypothetical protein
MCAWKKEEEAKQTEHWGDSEAVEDWQTGNIRDG